MGRKFGVSFSWKRAVGISAVKQKISRRTGIPLTRSGRQRKIGRLLGGFGWPLLLSSTQRSTGAASTPNWDDRYSDATPHSLGCGYCLGCCAIAVLLSLMFSVALTTSSRDSAKTATSQDREARHSVSGASEESHVSSRQEGNDDMTPRYADAKVQAMPDVRTWTDATGRYHVVAEFVSYGSGIVQLRKQNGMTITVPLERLSSDDIKYIRSKFTSRGVSPPF